jgi:hypothetical protein
MIRTPKSNRANSSRLTPPATAKREELDQLLRRGTGSDFYFPRPSAGRHSTGPHDFEKGNGSLEFDPQSPSNKLMFATSISAPGSTTGSPSNNNADPPDFSLSSKKDLTNSTGFPVRTHQKGLPHMLQKSTTDDGSFRVAEKKSSPMRASVQPASSSLQQTNTGNLQNMMMSPLMRVTSPTLGEDVTYSSPNVLTHPSPPMAAAVYDVNKFNDAVEQHSAPVRESVFGGPLPDAVSGNLLVQATMSSKDSQSQRLTENQRLTKAPVTMTPSKQMNQTQQQMPTGIQMPTARPAQFHQQMGPMQGYQHPSQQMGQQGTQMYGNYGNQMNQFPIGTITMANPMQQQQQLPFNTPVRESVVDRQMSAMSSSMVPPAGNPLGANVPASHAELHAAALRTLSATRASQMDHDLGAGVSSPPIGGAPPMQLPLTRTMSPVAPTQGFSSPLGVARSGFPHGNAYDRFTGSPGGPEGPSPTLYSADDAGFGGRGGPTQPMYPLQPVPGARFGAPLPSALQQQHPGSHPSQTYGGQLAHPSQMNQYDHRRTSHAPAHPQFQQGPPRDMYGQPQMNMYGGVQDVHDVNPAFYTCTDFVTLQGAPPVAGSSVLVEIADLLGYFGLQFRGNMCPVMGAAGETQMQIDVDSNSAMWGGICKRAPHETMSGLPTEFSLKLKHVSGQRKKDAKMPGKVEVHFPGCLRQQLVGAVFGTLAFAKRLRAVACKMDYHLQCADAGLAAHALMLAGTPGNPNAIPTVPKQPTMPQRNVLFRLKAAVGPGAGGQAGRTVLEVREVADQDMHAEKRWAQHSALVMIGKRGEYMLERLDNFRIRFRVTRNWKVNGLGM